MGGKVAQTNPAQASAANAGATTEAKALDAQATKNLGTQQDYMTQLFGSKGTDGNYSGGSLSGFTDPKTINNTTLGPVYDYMYKQAKGNIAQNSQQASQSLRQGMNNRGFSGGSGMEAAQNTQLALGEGQASGQAFGDALSGQHNEDLNNFWAANNLKSGNAASIGGQGTSQLQSSAQTYNNLYGTAGQGNVVPGVGGAIAAGLGTAAGGLLGNPKIFGCWIAEVLFGANDARTLLVRRWLNQEFAKSLIGKAVMKVYLRFGERIAGSIRECAMAKRALRPVFNLALNRAVMFYGGRE